MCCSALLVLPALAVKNAPNVTLVAVISRYATTARLSLIIRSVLRAGVLGRIACSSAAIEGWLSVTTAVDATGTGTRYDIGGGNNYGTDLADVPWGSLQAG